MKAQPLHTDTAKIKLPSAKKTVARKIKAKTKGTSSRRTTQNLSGSLAGYSEQAQQLLGRSKSALHAATNWAEATAKQIPNAARNLNFPDQKTAMDFAEQRPLIVGAVGFGLGLVLGAFLPKTSPHPTARRRK